MKKRLSNEETYLVRQAQAWALFWERLDQRLYECADVAMSSASEAEVHNLIQIWSARDTTWLWEHQGCVSEEAAQLWSHALQALNNSRLTLHRWLELREKVVGSKSTTYSSETAQGSAHDGVPEWDPGWE